MNTKPLYIFDLDGTLADLKHRRPLVEYPLAKCTNCGHMHNLRECRLCGTRHSFKPNWDAFHAACVDDTPIQSVITLIDQLFNDGVETWIWSGRMDTVRPETESWLQQHCPWYNQLKMRKQGDFTPDDQLKESWLLALPPEDRARLVMTFDDRDRVVAMWRRHGIVCAQVAPGDF